MVWVFGLFHYITHRFKDKHGSYSSDASHSDWQSFCSMLGTNLQQTLSNPKCTNYVPLLPDLSLNDAEVFQILLKCGNKKDAKTFNNKSHPIKHRHVHHRKQTTDF